MVVIVVVVEMRYFVVFGKLMETESLVDELGTLVEIKYFVVLG